MDFSELTKVAVDRIQNHEPENFRKIMGLILLYEPSETEMINLAYGPEANLLSRIEEINLMLRNLSPQNDSIAKNSLSFSSLSAFETPDEHWELPLCQSIDFAPRKYPNSAEESFTFSPSVTLKTSKRSPSLPEMPIKACHYFYKGYCKHGANCRYFHGHSPFTDGFSPAIIPSANEMQRDEPVFSPGSLAKLEMEIIELLRPRRGAPVSIALLPMLYYEKYGKSLQAEGYLTESQRNGKAGFSLTKLLARLKNTVRLIDRPHGQHSIILQEDVHKYLTCSNERTDIGPMAMSSHQIYLTFPAESVFTEDDVSNYFKQFGPVKDVRIPCQEKRMFGFVSFVYPETVIEILIKRVPHYICGARVLVKPYREKFRVVDRLYSEEINSAMFYPSQCPDLDFELQMLARELESSRGLKLHLREKEMLLEHERTHFSEFGLAQKPLNKRLNLIHDPDSLKFKVPDDFPFEDYFSCTMEALNLGLSTDNKARSAGNNYTDLGSGHIELPENPFAYQPPLGSSIPAVI